MLALAAACAGCTSERISSELEGEAVFACGAAIEQRRGESLPPGWQYRKQERDGRAEVLAWAPERDSESTPPDYTCRVARDERTPAGVRVLEVVEGAAAG